MDEQQEHVQPEQAQVAEEQAKPNEHEPMPDGVDKPKLVPLSAHEAERKKRQAAEQRIAQLEAAEAERQRAIDEASKSAQELLESRTTALEDAKARLAALEAREAARAEALAESNAKRLGKLPAAVRRLHPAGLDPDTAAQHIAELEAYAREASAPVGTRTHGGPKELPDLTPDERRQAERAGKTPEWWAEHVKLPLMQRKNANP